MKAGIFGIGAALPEEIVTNADLMKNLDTTDEWIVRRTGIRERRHLNGSRTLADLAAEACTMALKDAGRDAADVDRVMVCSLTPDRMMPGLAPAVALQIGCDLAGAVDLNAACAGFLYALDHAAGLVESGRANLVLVCGAEALSRITDHTDRGTAILFADGAGAVVVAAGDLDRGMSKFELRSDGRHSDLLYVDIDERLLRMEGREVYRHAVARMVEATTVALANAGIGVDDIDVFVAHQANARIIEAAARQARRARGEGHHQRRHRRQHLERVDPDRAVAGRAGRPPEARRRRRDGDVRRRLRLGRRRHVVEGARPCHRLRTPSRS